MPSATPDLRTPSAKKVLCPRCAMVCFLMPLHRPGAYRLVDPDGHGHAAVCIGSVEPVRRTVPYRPLPASPRPQPRPVGTVRLTAGVALRRA
jgi:hypothetical protein